MDIRYAFLCEGVELEPDGAIRSILRIIRPGLVFGADRFPFNLALWIVFFCSGKPGSRHILTVRLLDGTSAPAERKEIVTLPESGIAEASMRIGTLTVTAPMVLTVESLMDDNPFPFLTMTVPVERLH